jgi:hypothetical protein
MKTRAERQASDTETRSFRNGENLIKIPDELIDASGVARERTIMQSHLAINSHSFNGLFRRKLKDDLFHCNGSPCPVHLFSFINFFLCMLGRRGVRSAPAYRARSALTHLLACLFACLLACAQSEPFIEPLKAPQQSTNWSLNEHSIFFLLLVSVRLISVSGCVCMLI